jgi:UDP:flavonoid glycosyltransferase YjiC (YdhE family)
MTPEDCILFFCEGISFGHIARSVIIAQWLRELNLPLVVACTSTSARNFSAIGLDTVTIDVADPKAVYQRLREGNQMYEKEDLLKYFEQDDSLIRRIRPKLIVSEFRFTALQLANRYQIPSVGVTEATCHPNFAPYGTVPDPFAKPGFVPLWLLDFVAQRTWLGEVITNKNVTRLSRSLQQASVDYGLKPLPTFFHYASQGDLCLVCDHPELIPVSPLRPTDVYTGALRRLDPEPLPASLSGLDQKRKKIYIALGTQESLGTDFVEPYIRRLRSRGMQVVISRGGRTFDLSPSSDNVFVLDFVNESKLLPLIDLIVYPGGVMTTYQALSCAVPSIVLPAHANQHFYAEAIQQNNLGRCFRPSRLKLGELERATLDLLDNPTVAAATRTFQRKLQGFDRREAIVRRIQSLTT